MPQIPAALPPPPQYYSALGMWIRTPEQPFPSAKPALFLDRDGVIVVETDYLCRAADTRLIDGAGEVIAQANAAGIPIVQLTNQAGIGRGYYDWPDFQEVEDEIERLLAAEGARIDAVFACPFYPDGREPYRHPAHPARKPQPGMLLEAARRLNLDLATSWIVGDHWSDVLAGFNAGLRGAMHVLTGHGPEERPKLQPLAGFQTLLGESIADASSILKLIYRH